MYIFIRPYRTYYGNTCEQLAAGGVQSICSLNNLNTCSFDSIIIKLWENVCWQNISAKFDNQPDPMKNFGVMALEFAKINRVRSVAWTFFNGSSSNFVTLFVGIIPWSSSITSHIPGKTLELWPLNQPKLLSKLSLFFRNHIYWIIIKLYDNVCGYLAQVC